MDRGKKKTRIERRKGRELVTDARVETLALLRRPFFNVDPHDTDHENIRMMADCPIS